MGRPAVARVLRPWPHMSPGGRYGAYRAHRDRGTVTAELAVGLVGLALVLVAVLSFASVGREQLAVLDAAAAGARSAARGEPGAEVSRLAERLAGAGADVRVIHEGRLVTVVVRKRVTLGLPGGPQVTVAGKGTYPAEPQLEAG